MKKFSALILISVLFTGCAFQTSKGGGVYFLVENTSTLKQDGVEISNVSKPDIRSIKVIGSTSAGIVTGNMWAPAVVAGADSIGDGLGKVVNNTGDAVFQTQSQKPVPVAEPIPTPAPIPTPTPTPNPEPKTY